MKNRIYTEQDFHTIYPVFVSYKYSWWKLRKVQSILHAIWEIMMFAECEPNYHNMCTTMLKYLPRKVRNSIKEKLQ